MKQSFHFVNETRLVYGQILTSENFMTTHFASMATMFNSGNKIFMFPNNISNERGICTNDSNVCFKYGIYA